MAKRATPDGLEELRMKAVSLAAASLVVAFAITTAGGAMAQQFPAAPATQSTPYGQVGDAAYPPPPGQAPVGMHYEWIFGYDRHGDYLGHWTPVRDQ
jgi:hypothetical protein